MALKIRSHKLKNRQFDTWHQDWDYDDYLRDENWRKDWISFDCLCYVPDNDTVYAGISSFDADIFWGWDRKTEEWVSTGYDRVADPFDAKFHRSLIYHKGHLWGACALYHDIDNYWEAPGSPIIKYNPETNAIERLPAVLPHHYIQSTILDENNEIIYGVTFTPERLVSYNIKTDQRRDLGPIGSAMDMAQGENISFDDEGNVWGGWTITRAWQYDRGDDRHRLYKYSPRKDKIAYLKTGLPNPDGSFGYAQCEGIFNLGTGCLYASGANGSLYRIDTGTGKAEYLFTPIADRDSRLTSLALAADGFAYGGTGRNGKCELLRFDPKTEKYELLGDIVDEDGEACYQVHHFIALPDGTFYAAENDTPYRSSYLWEIKL